jgi:hypothetical protein
MIWYAMIWYNRLWVWLWLYDTICNDGKETGLTSSSYQITSNPFNPQTLSYHVGHTFPYILNLIVSYHIISYQIRPHHIIKNIANNSISNNIIEFHSISRHIISYLSCHIINLTKPFISDHITSFHLIAFHFILKGKERKTTGDDWWNMKGYDKLYGMAMAMTMLCFDMICYAMIRYEREASMILYQIATCQSLIIISSNHLISVIPYHTKPYRAFQCISKHSYHIITKHILSFYIISYHVSSTHFTSFKPFQTIS